MNAKRTQFVIEYPVDSNATQAAIRAGYSPRTAGSIGHALLKIPEVWDAIQARIDKLTMPKDEVLLRLGRQARGLEPTKKVIGKNYASSRNEYDMLGALTKIGQYHAMWVDKQINIDIEGMEFVEDEKTASTSSQTA